MSAAVDETPPTLAAARALREALRLVNHGYHLTPVTITRTERGDKHAKFHASWKRDPAGWSVETEQIRDWSVQHACSFAVVCGPSGVEGVDLDVKPAKNVDAVAWWATQGLPLGLLVVETPSGGLHTYWRRSGERTLPTSASEVAPGVDTRSAGGVFFAPGSFVLGLDGEPEQAGYSVQGPLPKVIDLSPTPNVVLDAWAVRKPEPAAGEAGVPDPSRLYTTEQAATYVREQGVSKLLEASEGGRNDALNNAALVFGHFVPAFWSQDDAVKWLTELAQEKGLDPREIGPTIRSGLNAGMAYPYTKVEKPAADNPFASASDSSAVEPGALSSWTAMDLTPYLDGTVERAEMSVGAHRKDGLRFFYPGLEHAVIGETEGGKTWFLLASAAEELITGNRVVYVHFEENDPGGTVSRLLRQFKVPSQRILDDFLFFGPEHPVPAGRIAEICDERVPTLVVLDGQNEAMALHSQKINDPDGAADFRRKLVKPWTRRGAAVAAADHVVKDPGQNGMGYALGSVHKLNGLSGAGFLVENREAFGEGMKGNSGIYVVKDRPGQLRKAGKATAVPRKFHLAEMVIDDTGDMWNICLHAPSAGDGPDPEFEQIREDRRRAELDDEVFAVAAGLIGKGLDVTASLVAAKVPRGKAIVLETLKRLEADERLVNISYGRAARYDLPHGVITAENEGS